MRHNRFLIAGILVITSACSGFKFVYNQLDWTIPLYIDRYVDLDVEQYSALEIHTEALLGWHCQERLHKYARWLQSIAEQTNSGGLTEKQIAAHQKVLGNYFSDITEQAAPRITKLLTAITDAQAAEIVESLNEKNIELQEKYLDTPADQLQAERLTKITKRLETWVGTVEDAQQKYIAAWVKGTEGGKIHWLKSRKRWQAEFEKALKARNNNKGFELKLKKLIVEPDYLWNKDYRIHVENMQRNTRQLISKISATLTPSQRLHLQAKLEDWRGDFSALSCSRN